MEPENERDTKAQGFSIGLCLHLVGLPLVALVPLEIYGLGLYDDYWTRLIVVAGCFGWTQLPYMLPAAFVLHRRGQRSARNGLLLATGLGFLVTSGCVGLVTLLA